MSLSSPNPRHTVTARREPLPLPTYPLGAPEKNPLFFEKRVYQGSCGKVYPVPFIDKVYDSPEEVRYDSVRLENDYVRLVLLPEIGGRILTGQDKTNSDYDFLYRQDVTFSPVGRVIDDWFTHYRLGLVVEAAVGKGRLLITPIDTSEHQPGQFVLNQFRNSVLDYMNSDTFCPTSELTEEQLGLILLESP